VRIENGWVNMKPVIDKQSMRVLLPEVRQQLIVRHSTILLLGITPNLPRRYGLLLNPTRSHRNKLFWNHKSRNCNNVPIWYNRAVFTKICDDPNVQQKRNPEELPKVKLSSCFAPGLQKMLEEGKNAQLQNLENEKNEKLKKWEEEKNETDKRFQDKPEIFAKKQWGTLPKKLALSRLLDKLEVRLEQPRLGPEIIPLRGQSALEKTKGASKAEYFEEEFSPSKSTTSTTDSQGSSENGEEN